ncbi:N-alpha-acetyltransferase_30 [Hexamita inflata]|uniref:N-alpha-acetyltransferase 30 n=1 Tax=Hexamita inflata TaxID=28002 RepID=A0AA86UYA4_9EUKA|nr:N-alpha-acetyltransferase 30 [Hexamita inflata]
MIIEHEYNSVQFRPFRNDRDLHAIRELFASQFSEPYQVWTYRFFAEQYPDLTFFAEKEGQIIGCCMCMLQNEHKNRIQGYIGMICVEDQYKRLKIGQHLADLAFEEFAKLNTDVVILETEDDNWRAIAFYERLGFYKSRHYYRYYLNGKGAYQMTKWMKQCDVEVSDE